MTVKHKNTCAISRCFSTSLQHLNKILQDPKPICTASRSRDPITSLLRTCSAARDLKPIHAIMIKNDVHQDSFFVNQFVAACSRLRQMDYARLVFNQMLAPNVFVYNAVIGGYVHCCMPAIALQTYLEMSRSPVLPTGYTYSSLVKACTQLSDMRLGETMHGKILKEGFGSQVFVQTGLIDFYSSSNKMEESRRVFDEMSKKDVFAWTTMVSAHAGVGDMGSARQLFQEMPERCTVSWNTMIAGYARVGDVDSAAYLFNQMLDRDAISWTTMISCYSQNKRFKEAVETFEAMKGAGVSPDGVTMATVISSCAHLGALDVGKELHHFTMLQGFDLDAYMGSALIDMYAKCGSIERSLVVFYKLREKNLFCWNSVVEGLAMHGRSKEALDMFSRMKKDEIEPNGVSFVSVLSACTHAGLVAEGRRMFSSMTTDHSISPEMEHYGCMVDLLGRAGLLQDALDLIGSMAMEPNSVIWGALLGGCKLHGDLVIAEVALQKLLGLEPDNSGYHMLLVNMYAEANKWGEVAAARSLMKNRGVEKKNPGCSWIEMDGIVHEFAAADVSHASLDEICILLIGVDGQLRFAGCTPDLSSFNSFL